MKTTEIDRNKILTDAELVALFSRIEEFERAGRLPDACFLVRFVIGTGCRVSEIAPLRIEQDCEKNGVIHIRHGKGDKYRMVKTTPELFPHYAQRIAQIRSGLLFPRRDPRVDSQVPYSTRTLESMWEDVLCAAGLRRLSIHKGRHTWATNEILRLSLSDVQQLAGHSKLSTTSSFYLHVNMDRLYQEGPPEWWAIARGEEQPIRERKLRVVK